MRRGRRAFREGCATMARFCGRAAVKLFVGRFRALGKRPHPSCGKRLSVSLLKFLL